MSKNGKKKKKKVIEFNSSFELIVSLKTDRH